MPEARVAADHLEPAAHHHGGIEPGAGQELSRHRGGGGLAVGTADGDAVVEAHDLGQHLAAPQGGQAEAAPGPHLGILRADGGGDDDEIGAPHLPRGVPDEDLDAQLGQAVGDLRTGQVAAADLVVHPQQDLGEAAHAGPADAHEVDPAHPTGAHARTSLRPRRRAVAAAAPRESLRSGHRRCGAAARAAATPPLVAPPPLLAAPPALGERRRRRPPPRDRRGSAGRARSAGRRPDAGRPRPTPDPSAARPRACPPVVAPVPARRRARRLRRNLRGGPVLQEGAAPPCPPPRAAPRAAR